MIAETEESLIENVKVNKCEESLKELSRKHSGLYIDICKKYFQRLEQVGVFSEDVRSEKNYVVYKSALSYNSDKGAKFSTWLANCARYHCLNTISSNKKHFSEGQGCVEKFLDDRSIENFTNSDNLNLKEYVFEILGQLKDKRIKQIFEFRYFPSDTHKPTWNRISRQMGVSIQTAINLHQKGRRILFSKINSRKTEDFI